jgi:type II secretory pathway pseudopilin PulG
MIKKNKYAITILELIIVVSIVAILGLVAYVSLNSYSKNAMNSSRITDIQTIRKSLELFSLEAGKFPDPTNGFKVTYNSNLEAWSQ